MFLLKDREWLNGFEPIVFAFTNFQYGTEKNREIPGGVGRNLIADKKQKDKRNTWNVYSFPAPDNKVGLAISFTRKF